MDFSSSEMQGWYNAPNVRGSWDIVWSCLLVIFTAVWTVLHLNVPSESDGFWRITFRHIRWVALTVLAPDMLTSQAAAQWDNARKSVIKMHELGYKGWTLEHGFYADSGGFFIDAPDVRPFPVSSASIHYLLRKGYISYPSLTKEEIWDKSKADKFAKGAALLQSGYLVVQSCARAVQGLPITPLEVFTLAFVISTGMTYFFWFRKPQHVGTPTYLPLSCSIATVLCDAGDAADFPFRDTPMDFVEKPTQVWVRRRIIGHYDLPERPLTRLPDDAIMPNEWGPLMLAFVGIPSMLHSTIHLLGWNFQYPTDAEKWLWRISSLTLAIVGCSSAMAVAIVRRTTYAGQINMAWLWVKAGREGKGLRFRSLDIVFTITTLALVVARLYIISEAIASLRLLPSSCYDTVNWTSFLPHVV